MAKANRIVCPPEDRAKNLSELMRRCTIDSTTNCWVCHRVPDDAGYCNISINAIAGKWHRVVYAIVHGECPAATEVDHQCNNRACGNPDHLVLGTHRDNMSRMSLQKRHGSHVKPENLARGSQHYLSRFSDEQVREIWQCVDGGESLPSIVARSGVSQATIRSIALRYNYRHLLSEADRLKWPARKTYKQVQQRSPWFGVATDDVIERFRKRLVESDKGCMVLRRTGDESESPSHGATGFSINGLVTTAYRAAWIIDKGPIPDGLLVRHSCRNGRYNCCDIRHLSLGTDEDNAKDTLLAGNHSSLKTTPEMVLSIFSLYATGKFSTTEMAPKFDLSVGSIVGILARRSHRHIAIPEDILEAVSVIRKLRRRRW